MLLQPNYFQVSYLSCMHYIYLLLFDSVKRSYLMNNVLISTSCKSQVISEFKLFCVIRSNQYIFTNTCLPSQKSLHLNLNYNFFLNKHFLSYISILQSFLLSLFIATFLFFFLRRISWNNLNLTFVNPKLKIRSSRKRKRKFYWNPREINWSWSSTHLTPLHPYTYLHPYILTPLLLCTFTPLLPYIHLHPYIPTPIHNPTPLHPYTYSHTYTLTPLNPFTPLHQYTYIYPYTFTPLHPYTHSHPYTFTPLHPYTYSHPYTPTPIYTLTSLHL